MPLPLPSVYHRVTRPALLLQRLGPVWGHPSMFQLSALIVKGDVNVVPSSVEVATIISRTDFPIMLFLKPRYATKTLSSISVYRSIRQHWQADESINVSRIKKSASFVFAKTTDLPSVS